MIVKTVNREMYGALFIANESAMQTDSTYFDKVAVTVKGSQDVYYFDMRNGNIYVYRAKLRNVVNGCVFLRDRSEYDVIYSAVQSQGYANMPENYFSALDRKWNAQLESGMNG